MGIKINFRAKEICMLQFKNSSIHQDDSGNYYYDGTPNNEPDSGIIVDFAIEHSYVIFEKLGNYWGGWNLTPTWQVMYEVAKNWEEKYGANIVEIDNGSIVFSLRDYLSVDEIELLANEIKNLQGAIPCYSGGFEEMKRDICSNSRFEIWWD